MARRSTVAALLTVPSGSWACAEGVTNKEPVSARMVDEALCIRRRMRNRLPPGQPERNATNGQTLATMGANLEHKREHHKPPPGPPITLGDDDISES